jgi:predicted Zn-dependent peptidase
MDQDNPEYLVHEIFTSNFWMGHPLGKPILGTKDSVPRFSRGMIDAYYGKHYVPTNMFITAAGNLTHERLVSWRASDSKRCRQARMAEPMPRR